MNVLILDNETAWRGGQEQIFTLIRGLHRRGVQVALMAPEAGLLAQRVRHLGVLFIPIARYGELALGLVAPLRRILAGRRWDIIHFNTPCGIAVAAFLSRLAGVPVRLLSRRVNFKLRGPVSRWKYLYSADYIITVSSGIATTLIGSGIPADRVE
ncbi:MAG: glycosyltransferase, partial [Acidobacteria bacterium]|nr:glycosyltransferase [Acidobacteriota bacterium]